MPHYDFNWQLQYRFAEPVPFKSGSGIIYTAWYDNSTDNPANPNPKKAVRWGPQTDDEMHLGYIEFVIDGNAAGSIPRPGRPGAGDVKVPPGGVTIPEQYKAALKKYDLNSDGKLDDKEIDAMPPAVKSAVMGYIKRMMP